MSVPRSTAQWLVVGLVALAAGACSRGLLTYFPHRAHLDTTECGGTGQQACLSCLSCHQGTPQSPEVWVQPSAQKCTSCHHDGQQKWQASVRPAIATVPAGKQIVFAHDQHLATKELKGQCVKCHAGAVGVEGGAPLFPPMQTCTGCHRHREQFEANVCTNCHQGKDLRGLVPVSFFPHDGAWSRRHGAEARTAPERCATCHAQTSCDTCHDSSKPLGPAVRNPEALEAGFVHRFDFQTRHALEARSQPGRCVTCHQKTECDACHITRGVSAALSGGANPHPRGWASGLGALTNQHGAAARRDLDSCASCHDQGPATNCVTCHRVGGTGGTPHPPRWTSTQPLSSPACAVCHGGVQ